MLRIFLINEWVLCTPAYYPLLPFSLSHQFQFVNATFVRHLPSWNMIRVPRQIHARCRCKFGSKYSSNVWRWTLTAHHFVLFWSRATGFMSSNEYIANSISRSVWQGHVFRRQQNTHTHTLADRQPHTRARYEFCVNCVCCKAKKMTRNGNKQRHPYSRTRSLPSMEITIAY